MALDSGILIPFPEDRKKDFHNCFRKWKNGGIGVFRLGGSILQRIHGSKFLTLISVL